MKTQMVVLLTLVLFLSSHSPLRGQGKLLPVVDDDEGNEIRTYIVQVRRSGGRKLLGEQESVDWHRSFLPTAALDSGEPRLVYSYRHAISGFAARLSGEEARAMEAKDGFVTAIPAQTLPLLTTYTPSYLGLNRWDGLWAKPNHGEGVVIGVVDGGIVPSHPSFRDAEVPRPPGTWRGRCDLDEPACNNKVIGAMAFLSGNDSSSADADGHGSHVASIAAGNFVTGVEVRGEAMGSASGMAPKAHLAIYRACWVYDCKEENLLAAVDQAIDDGVDILNLSNGQPSLPFYKTHLAIATFAAMETGILVVSAAGNDGPGRKTIGNDFPWVLTVGASATDRRIKMKGKNISEVQFGVNPHPSVADVSSRGPSDVNGGIIKPDVLAPGEDIVGAWHKPTNASFAFQTGTSLAAPHVSGIAALIMKSHRDWFPVSIRSAIMTTALPNDAGGQPIRNRDGRNASFHDMGAGHVNPSAANDPGLVYEIDTDDYVRYLCGLGYSDEQVWWVTRREIDCSTFGSIAAEQLNYPSISLALDLTSKTTITRKVKNVGEPNSVYKVEIVEPKGLEVSVHPKELKFKRKGETKSFEVKLKRKHRASGGTFEGHLVWRSGKYVVRSPILVNTGPDPR